MIGVVWNRDSAKGIDTLEEAEKSGLSEMVSMHEALEMEWGDDAHLTCYTVVGAEEGWPRLNKPALPQIRDAGGDVEMHWLVLDYDNAGHKQWTPDLLVEFCDKLGAAQDAEFELALRWTYFYTTKNGARFVYELDKPVSPEEFEPLYRGVVRDWKPWLEMDPSCDQWNRLFRLPKVVRGGKKTSNNPFFDFIINDLAGSPWSQLQVSEIEPGEKKLANNVVAEKLNIGQPEDAEDAVSLVWTTSERRRLTDLGKRLKARLKGRDCYPCIFEHKPIADEGSRDIEIQRHVGSACALTYNIEGNSPEAVYGLFVEAVFDLETDEGTGDWTVVLWRAVLKWWAKEAALQKKEEEQKEIQEQENQNFAYALVDRMAEWCEAPELRSENKGDAAMWMSQRMIACGTRGYFVMRADGYYDRSPVGPSHLPAKIRELKMDGLMSLEVPRATGNGTRDVTSQELINRYGTLLSRIEGAVGIPGSHIKDIGTERAMMTVQLFKYNPRVRPKYDKEVDEWLKQFSCTRWNYAQICEWIGHALAFEDGPICALSVAGPPAIGKKLLAQGLAECIDTEVFADSTEFGRFQAMLLRTPFLVVNEGFPDLNGARSPADAFRMLVSGDPMSIERKFMDPMTVRNPLRLLFTANNLDVVEMLAGGKDLSPDDREALGQRLLHFDLKNDAADWLSSKGGMRFTARKNRRWIRGDDGQKSDYVVANHFMWLYEQRKPPSGDRLLVEGAKDSHLVQSFATRSGSAPAVVEAVCKMIESKTPTKGFVILEEKGKIWATPSSVVDYWRGKLAGQTRIELTTRKVGRVFRGLRLRGSSTSPRQLPAKTEISQKARWIELDPTLLLTEAEEFGYENDKLRRLALTNFEDQVEAKT